MPTRVQVLIQGGPYVPISAFLAKHSLFFGYFDPQRVDFRGRACDGKESGDAPKLGRAGPVIPPPKPGIQNFQAEEAPNPTPAVGTEGGEEEEEEEEEQEAITCFGIVMLARKSWPRFKTVEAAA